MAEASSILRNGERPGDQEPEVVWDVCSVGQLQVVGGHQLTQHLGGHRGGGGWRCISPLFSSHGSGVGTQTIGPVPQKGLKGHLRSR